MGIKVGLEAKLFYGSAGTQGSTEATNVKDVTLSMEAATADITTRAASGWRMKKATLKEASLEIGANYDPENAFCTSVISAYLGGNAMAFFVSDGSGNGLDADFTITNYTIEQPLEEAISISITAEPTFIGGSSGRAPNWVTSGSSANSGSSATSA